MKTVSLSVFCVVIGNCPAALIYSGPQNIPIPTTFAGVSLDLLAKSYFFGEPAPDWSNSQVNFFFGGSGIFSGPRFLPVRAGTEATSMIVSLMIGDQVGPTSFFGPVGNGVSEDHIGLASNQFASGAERFFGFRLDRTGNGEFVNGFMRVTLTNGNQAGVIHEWTYSDTVGETITVGAIPEPSSAVLIGFSSTALLLLRRRRIG
jgi:hypothetical protein